MNRKNAWPLSSDSSWERIARNTDYVNQFLPSKGKKNSKNHCLCWRMLELSGTTIVSPQGFFPLSLAPEGWRTREWKHSQSCTQQKYLYSSRTKITCVRFDISYMIQLYIREAQMYMDLQHSSWAANLLSLLFQRMSTSWPVLRSFLQDSWC